MALFGASFSAQTLLHSSSSDQRTLPLPTSIQIMWVNTSQRMPALLLLLLAGCASLKGVVEGGVIERCNGAVVELVPCTDAIKGKGADRVSHGCCMALSELLLSPECLCYAATTAQAPFDMKQILGLPAACKYHVPPHQTCEGIPIPSYSKRPLDDEHTPIDEVDDLPLRFSDEVREDIREEFRAHQARLDNQSP